MPGNKESLYYRYRSAYYSLSCISKCVIYHTMYTTLTVVYSISLHNCMILCSWDVGPAHVIAIDSEFYFFIWDGLELIGEQFRWLEEDLKQANQPAQRAKRPWIIIMYHHPMYCTTLDDDDCNHHESIVRINFEIVINLIIVIVYL